jgi:hypothetical protein
LSRFIPQTEEHSEISIQQLDWTEFDAGSLPVCTVIVGSDLVYALSLIDPLISVLKSLLERDFTRNAFIACTHRNGEALQAFADGVQKEESLQIRRFLKRTFTPSDGVLMSREPLHPVTLFHITKR